MSASMRPVIWIWYEGRVLLRVGSSVGTVKQQVEKTLNKDSM